MPVTVSPARLLANYLASIGIGVISSSPTAVWPITWSKLPDNEPKRRIALFDTGKAVLLAHQRQMGAGSGTPQKPLVQMRIRTEDTGYDVGYAKGEAIAGKDGIFDMLRNAIVTVDSLTFKIESARVYIPFTPIGQEPPPSTTKNWHFTANVRLVVYSI